MHTLIVVAHPNTTSLTHTLARQIAQGISEAGTQHSVEIADLSAEGFDPRFSTADLDFFNQDGEVPSDVAAEQARLDKADSVLLVYPLYWWSFPALLKGWIDRVFTRGWAYDDAEGRLVKKLQHLPIHLVALGGADQQTIVRHGYDQAMKTQIEHGIFGYCGAPVASSTLFLASDDGYPHALLASAKSLGNRLASSHSA